jgi:hypothetical protein
MPADMFLYLNAKIRHPFILHTQSSGKVCEFRIFLLWIIVHDPLEGPFTGTFGPSQIRRIKGAARGFSRARPSRAPHNVKTGCMKQLINAV